jgi:V8-like Glu-specific endopeptidase
VTSEPEPPWWTAIDPGWTEAEADQLVGLLAGAYPDPPALPALSATGFTVPAAPGGPAKPQAIWAKALQHAVQEQVLHQLIRPLLDEQRQKEADEALTDILERVVEAEAGLERSGSGNGEHTDGPSEVEVLEQLIRRTAIIRIDGSFSGTGCLIGNELLLTCRHVIEQPGGELAAPSSIEVRFGFNRRRATTYAETGYRVLVDGIVSHSPPTDAERRPAADLNWSGDADHLDYAVLQLAAPAELEDGKLTARGYYPLHFQRYRFRPRETLTIAHHPRGELIRFSHIYEVPTLLHNGTRIAYQCDTEPGSSGGPIVTVQGRLVALHNFSSRTEKSGIPASAIADDLRRKKIDYLFEEQGQGNVTQGGWYTRRARQQVCSALSGDLPPLARYLAMPGFITDSYQLWDWLAKHKQLRKLRNALEAAGRTELVQVLDADQVIVDEPQIDEIAQLAQQISNHAAAARATRAFAVSVMQVRLLADKLTSQLERLPTFADDDRLELDWRMTWGTKREDVRSALRDLTRALPAIDAQAYQAQHATGAVLRFARALLADATILHELAGSPDLAAP